MESRTGIYGEYGDFLPLVERDLRKTIEQYSREEQRTGGSKIIEHLSSRVKSEESMRDKCIRKGLPATPESSLRMIHDAVGVRIICGFIEDIYANVRHIRSIPGWTVVEEKDYITNVKPNGYRSYHMIIRMKEPFPDPEGNLPGIYYAEIQLRTIAMDSWASLEHQMKYKKNITNPGMITAELKRCADELAGCDLSMQTIRSLIRVNDDGREEKR